MISLGETLALQTVEHFLQPEELTQLRKIMDQHLRVAGWTSGPYAQLLLAPDGAQEILRQATARSLPVIRRSMPSIDGDVPWHYTELLPGMSVPAHIDGIPHPATPPRRLGRIGVVVEEADGGGQFYLETTSSGAVWSGHDVGEADGYADGTPLTHDAPHLPGPDVHAAEPPWLAGVRRTRWISDSGAGTAVAYGAQVLHGVTTVQAGRLRKFVTDLVDTNQP
ncbi:hypothetical protein [Streptomyces cinnamoneus]|uniref:hypothetical protein n=1 Tax=Streptomyces cinnamoneus TaxID=53446 RepID=UPI00379BB28B